MAEEKRIAVNEWTHGKAVGFIPYSWFHKDETALLNPPSEVLFFQTFGLDPEAKAGYVPPGPDNQRWFSQDYDARWRLTVLLRPTYIGQAAPLDWKTIKELRAKKLEEEANLDLATAEKELRG